MTLQIAKFLQHRLAGTIDFKIERRVFVRACDVSNHPSKLVGVHLRSCKLCNLFKSICVGTVNFDDKSVSPIRRTVSRIGTNNVISRINWFFPDLEGSSFITALNNLCVFEVHAHDITIAVGLVFLCFFERISATRIRKERGACHYESIVFRRRKLLIHESIVFDAFHHLPAPPSNLARVNLNAVKLLNVAHPFLLFACQLAVPIDFVNVRVGISGIVLVAPPAAEDRTLGTRLLSRDVHVVKYIEAARRAFKHVKTQRVSLCERGKEGRETFLIAPRTRLGSVQVSDSLTASKRAFRSKARHLIEQARAVLKLKLVSVMGHRRDFVFLGQTLQIHRKGRTEHVTVFFRVGRQRALQAGVHKVPVEVEG